MGIYGTDTDFGTIIKTETPYDALAEVLGGAVRHEMLLLALNRQLWEAGQIEIQHQQPDNFSERKRWVVFVMSLNSTKQFDSVQEAIIYAFEHYRAALCAETTES